MNWRDGYKPIAGRQYGPALEHAQERYEELARAFQSLSNRADGLMRTAATLAGLLFTAVRVVHSKTDWQPGAMTFVSFLLFVLAMILSMQALLPMDRATPRDTAWLFAELDERSAADQDPFLAGVYHCAAVGLVVSNNWKARQCTAAGRLIGMGLAFLLPTLFGFA